MKRFSLHTSLRGLLAASALGALAMVGSSMGGDLGGTSSSSAGLTIADEAIGSLPTYWAPPGPVILPGLDGALLASEQLKPSIQITLPYAAYSGAFVGGHGPGYALLTDLEDGKLLVRLHGDVTVSVKRGVLESPDVVSVLRQGLLFENGLGKIHLQGIEIPAFDLSMTGGAVGLLYSDPYYASLFQNGGVSISLVNDAKQVGLLRSSLRAEVITMTQTSD